MKTSEQLDQLGTDLALANTEIAHSDSSGKAQGKGGKQYKYATITDVVETIRPVYAKYGLSILQAPECINEHWFMVTRLLHKSGQWIETSLPLYFNTTAPNIMQEFGSSMTYSRRYSCVGLAFLGIEDSDGAEITAAAPKNMETKRAPVDQRRIDPPKKQEASPVTPPIPEPVARVVLNPLPDNVIDVLVSDLGGDINMDILTELKTQAASCKANMTDEQIKRVGVAINEAMVKLGLK